MKPKQEIRSLNKSFYHAFAGLRHVIGSERNFRIHICMMLYVLAFSFIGKVSAGRLSLFLVCFASVISAEMMNTAIELLCDLVADSYKSLVKTIKDVAAGAVLVCAIFSAAAGLITFLSAETLGNIGRTFAEMPYVAVIIALSLPLALVFIFKRKK